LNKRYKRAILLNGSFSIAASLLWMDFRADVKMNNYGAECR